LFQELSAVNLVQSVGSVEQYMLHAETIERAVVVRTMGTMGDPKLRDDILAMKKRMISALAREKGASDTVINMCAALDAGQTETAIQLAKVLTDEYYDIGATTIVFIFYRLSI
jgi:glutamine synthetase adenylyltransferase